MSKSFLPFKIMRFPRNSQNIIFVVGGSEDEDRLTDLLIQAATKVSTAALKKNTTIIHQNQCTFSVLFWLFRTVKTNYQENCLKELWSIN